ncbi:hypothetical protein AB833_11110 [Chromatiales bacterium (ex Bugula neritina AB1)]|nr:hypothetical protein AB833_11110 [Chromatiales bacterium (ex Bugula neritina AB1)]
MQLTTIGSQLTGLAAIGCYLMSAVLLYRTVATPQTDSAGSVSRSTIWQLGMAAAALHTLMLISSFYQSHGLNLGFFNALSVTAWVTTVIVLLLNIGRPVLNLGLILFPVSALTLALSLVFKGNFSTVSTEVRWHVLISIVAYALLTIAAGQSLLVSLQDRRLHNRRPGGLLRALPPLKVMETVLFQLLVASFLLLSLALLSGFVFLDDLFAQRLVHKTTLSLFAWGILAVLLIGQLCWGWRGQKAALMTTISYASLVLGYFGSKFVLEVILA